MDESRLDNVVHLPDVAGPVVLQKKLKCAGVEADDLAALTVVLLGDKDIDQLADLPMTAAERRDVNIANAEPVEEVVPQRPVGLRRDVAVGRGPKPHVAAHTSVTAHGEDFRSEEHTSELQSLMRIT